MLSRRYFFRFIAGLGAFGTSTVAYGFGVEPLVRLRVTRYDIMPPQWPAGFKLKIAVVADLHACNPWMSPVHIERVVKHTNALDADVIVMLGDYVAGHRYVTQSAGIGLGVGASPVESAAWRARDSRQPRLLVRPSNPAGRAGQDRRAAGPRGRRHSRVRERCGAIDQGWSFLLDCRARRPARLSAGLALQAGSPCRRRRSWRDAGKGHRRCASRSPGARARYCDARPKSCRASAFGSYPWRSGQAVRMVAGRAVALRKPAGLWAHPD